MEPYGNSVDRTKSFDQGAKSPVSSPSEKSKAKKYTKKLNNSSIPSEVKKSEFYRTQKAEVKDISGLFKTIAGQIKRGETGGLEKTAADLEKLTADIHAMPAQTKAEVKGQIKLAEKLQGKIEAARQLVFNDPDARGDARLLNAFTTLETNNQARLDSLRGTKNVLDQKNRLEDQIHKYKQPLNRLQRILKVFHLWAAPSQQNLNNKLVTELNVITSQVNENTKMACGESSKVITDLKAIHNMMKGVLSQLESDNPLPRNVKIALDELHETIAQSDLDMDRVRAQFENKEEMLSFVAPVSLENLSLKHLHDLHKELQSFEIVEGRPNSPAAERLLQLDRDLLAQMKEQVVGAEGLDEEGLEALAAVQEASINDSINAFNQKKQQFLDANPGHSFDVFLPEGEEIELHRRGLQTIHGIASGFEGLRRQDRILLEDPETNYDEIIPNVWLGASQPVNNDWKENRPMVLDGKAMQTVISLVPVTQKNPPDENHILQDLPDGVRWPDDTYKEVADGYIELADRMHERVSQGQSVYLHCSQGLSRSPTVLATYLIKYHGLTSEQALAVILNGRPEVQPNHNFIHLLKSMDTYIKNPDSLDDYFVPLNGGTYQLSQELVNGTPDFRGIRNMLESDAVKAGDVNYPVLNLEEGSILENASPLQMAIYLYIQTGGDNREALLNIIEIMCSKDLQGSLFAHYCPNEELSRLLINHLKNEEEGSPLLQAMGLTPERVEGLIRHWSNVYPSLRNN